MMKSMLRFTLLWVAVVLLAGLVMGCTVKASVETDTRFERPDQVQDPVPYTSGHTIRVECHNGHITMNRGSSSDVEVTFKPFTMRPGDEKEQAEQEMKEDLILSVTDTGTSILIIASRESGANPKLGADVVVDLPAGFDGGIEVDQNNGQVDANLTGGMPLYTTIASDNGSIDVEGAAGQLDIFSDNGDVDVTVQGWSPNDGSVTIDGPGDMTFGVAQGLSGRIHATAGDPGDAEALVSGPSGGDWVETVNADNDKSYEFGTDPASGGLVTLSTSFFTSTITISN